MTKEPHHNIMIPSESLISFIGMFSNFWKGYIYQYVTSSIYVGCPPIWFIWISYQLHNLYWCMVGANTIYSCVIIYSIKSGIPYILSVAFVACISLLVSFYTLIIIFFWITVLEFIGCHFVLCSGWGRLITSKSLVSVCSISVPSL